MFHYHFVFAPECAVTFCWVSFMVLIIVTLAYSWDVMCMCRIYEMVSKIFQLVSQQHINLHVHVRICSHWIQSLQCQDIFSRDNFLFFFLQRERSMGLVDHLLWILSSVSGLSFLELTLTGTDNTSINGGASCLF